MEILGAKPSSCRSRRGGRRFGLAVDRAQRQRDLLLRLLHPSPTDLAVIGGACVLGHEGPVAVMEPDEMAPQANRRTLEGVPHCGSRMSGRSAPGGISPWL
jgi:chemotaxis protein histidine kinase CheA